VVARAGPAPDGLPIGIQVVAQYLEQAWGGWQHPLLECGYAQRTQPPMGAGALSEPGIAYQHGAEARQRAVHAQCAVERRSAERHLRLRALVRGL
jgi:hypothetical protein